MSTFVLKILTKKYVYENNDVHCDLSIRSMSKL